MDGIYFFIIWSKARWWKRRIINDLETELTVLSCKDVFWDKMYFEKNIGALYGVKLFNIKEKVRHCGQGKFTVVFVRDDNPNIEERTTTEGVENVNTHMFDLKAKYRRWTGGGHRIHCPNNMKEARHDFVVLFGDNFDIVSSDKKNLYCNSKGVEGFESDYDFCNCLKLFGDLAFFDYKESLVIFAKCRNDVIRFICPDRKVNDYEYEVRMRMMKKKVYVFGEKEGDIPDRTVEAMTEYYDTDIQSALGNIDEFADRLKNDAGFTKQFVEFMKKHGLSEDIIRKDPFIHYSATPLLIRIKDEVKYILSIISNIKNYE